MFRSHLTLWFITIYICFPVDDLFRMPPKTPVVQLEDQAKPQPKGRQAHLVSACNPRTER